MTGNSHEIEVTGSSSPFDRTAKGSIFWCSEFSLFGTTAPPLRIQDSLPQARPYQNCRVAEFLPSARRQLLHRAAEAHEANASCPAQSMLALCFITSGPRLAFSPCQAGAPTPVQPRDLRSPWGAWTPKRSRRALASLPQSGAQRGERGTARPMPAGSLGGASPRPAPGPEAAGRGRGGPARCRPLRGPAGPGPRPRPGPGPGPPRVYQHGRSRARAGRRLPAAAAGRAAFALPEGAGQRWAAAAWPGDSFPCFP